MAASILSNLVNGRLHFDTFNPTNTEHLKAYVCLRDFGRQHPTLRFHLEEPHLCVPTMMAAKISDAYLARYKTIISDVQAMVSKLPPATEAFG